MRLAAMVGLVVEQVGQQVLHRMLLRCSVGHHVVQEPVSLDLLPMLRE